MLANLSTAFAVVVAAGLWRVWRNGPVAEKFVLPLQVVPSEDQT
jgi:hypothetical protein